jgi:organic radical activating enzyme
LGGVPIMVLTSWLRLDKVPGIAITGGEPFLVQEEMRYLISTAQKHGVDIAKITSNAFWGKDDCSKTIDPLIEAGILNNRHFVPTFMFSIGEQTTPLPKVAKALHYMHERFSEEQISLALSSLKMPGENDKTAEFVGVYEGLYGSFPHMCACSRRTGGAEN